MESSISEYLLKKLENGGTIRNGRIVYNGDLKEAIETVFGLEENRIPGILFDAAISGNGKEGDKIDRIYSSALQALLFWSFVSKDNPFYYAGKHYTKVLFEHKNPVINSPSCIDVALFDDKEENVLFIESKFCEIIRDSDKDGKCEIGPSYFSNANGYHKLGLSYQDLKDIGIDCEGIVNERDYVNEPSDSEMKRTILSHIDKDPKRIQKKTGYLRVKPLAKKGYVYSYGIKQVLSHLIGILNYQETSSSVHVSFLTVFNKLPGYDQEEWRTKEKDFCKHYEMTIKTVNHRLGEKKNLSIIKKPLSYQKIYTWKDEQGENLYRVPGSIERFYRLTEKTQHNKR